MHLMVCKGKVSSGYKFRDVEKHICAAFTGQLPSLPGVNKFHDFNYRTKIRISSVKVYIFFGDEDNFWSLGRTGELSLICGKMWILSNAHSLQGKKHLYAIFDRP